MSEWERQEPYGFIVPKPDPQTLDSGLVLPPGKTRMQYLSERVMFQLPSWAVTRPPKVNWGNLSFTTFFLDDLEKPEPPPPPLKQSKRDEVIIGWRTWWAIEVGNVVLLRSRFKTDYHWPVGEPATLIDHQAQYFNSDPKCHSGVHAFKTLSRMRVEYGPNPRSVYGKVALWGRVYSHEHGYRAEFAYPTHIYTPTKDLARKLRSTYGCETTWDHRRPLPDLPAE